MFMCSHSEVRGAEGANEGPEAGDLLAGDGPMGGLRGELRPSGGGVGVLAHLLPHLQEPHPAPPYHEHRSVRKIYENSSVYISFMDGK